MFQTKKIHAMKYEAARIAMAEILRATPEAGASVEFATTHA